MLAVSTWDGGRRFAESDQSRSFPASGYPSRKHRHGRPGSRVFPGPNPFRQTQNGHCNGRLQLDDPEIRGSHRRIPAAFPNEAPRVCWPVLRFRRLHALISSPASCPFAHRPLTGRSFSHSSLISFVSCPPTTRGLPREGCVIVRRFRHLCITTFRRG